MTEGENGRFLNQIFYFTVSLVIRNKELNIQMSEGQFVTNHEINNNNK